MVLFGHLFQKTHHSFLYLVCSEVSFAQPDDGYQKHLSFVYFAFEQCLVFAIGFAYLALNPIPVYSMLELFLWYADQ